MSQYTVKQLDPKDGKKLDEAFGITPAFIELDPGKCVWPPQHLKILQQILDAPVREDDVWLLSYPRTGSTWCQEMIWLIINNLDFETAKNTIQQFRAPLIEMSTALAEYQKALGSALENSVDFVNNLPSPRCIKSHSPLQFLPTQLDKIKPKIIYTCRNPKDMVVSYYDHFKLLHNMTMPFEDFCDLIIRGIFPPAPLFDHYLQFWNKRHETNVLFLTYEEMKQDLRTTLKKIATFLEKELSEEQFDLLCDYLSIEKMRDNRGCNLEVLLEGEYGKDYYKRKGSHFIRKGVVGDWKNYMSPELSQRFDEWIEEKTRGTGLSFD